MSKRSFAALAALMAFAGLAPAQPTNTVDVQGIGKVVLVNRDQLRFTLHDRTFRAQPGHGLAEYMTPPTTFDWSKGGALKFPILGNNRVGDCYYAATAHASQTYTGNAGKECEFDEAKLVARYRVLSHGDNGLSDSQIMPEWKKGIVGPDGPHKILDEMTVSLKDTKAQQLAAWGFGGLIWTCEVKSGWVGSHAYPGAVWDAGQGGGVGGHAMYLTGKNDKGNWVVQTWGIAHPYVQVTPRGVLDSDSEFIVAFSLDQFKPDGTSAFTGLHYEDMASLWQSMGGKPLPPSPFPPPKPHDDAPAGHWRLIVVVVLGVLLVAGLVFVVLRKRAAPPPPVQ